MGALAITDTASGRVYEGDPVFAMRWRGVVDRGAIEQSLARLEHVADAWGHPVVSVVVIPPDVPTPAMEMIRYMIASIGRFERATRRSILVLEGRGMLQRANLSVLQTFALASERSRWLYFRGSSEEALRDFPPPELGVDPDALLRTLRAHEICAR